MNSRPCKFLGGWKISPWGSNLRIKLWILLAFMVIYPWYSHHMPIIFPSYAHHIPIIFPVPGLVDVYITNWKITMLLMGKSTIKVPFSISMLNYRRNSKLLVYQRVYPLSQSARNRTFSTRCGSCQTWIPWPCCNRCLQMCPCPRRAGAFPVVQGVTFLGRQSITKKVTLW